MDINTKASVRDTIFFMADNKVTSERVQHIEIQVCNKQHLYEEKISISILYYTDNDREIHEKDVFLSKQELLDSL